MFGSNNARVRPTATVSLLGLFLWAACSSQENDFFKAPPPGSAGQGANAGQAGTVTASGGSGGDTSDSGGSNAMNGGTSGATSNQGGGTAKGGDTAAGNGGTDATGGSHADNGGSGGSGGSNATGGTDAMNGGSSNGDTGGAGEGGESAGGAGAAEGGAPAAGTGGALAGMGGSTTGGAGMGGASAGTSGTSAGTAGAGIGGTSAGTAGGASAGAAGTSAGAGGTSSVVTCSDDNGCLTGQYCKKSGCDSSLMGVCETKPTSCSSGTDAAFAPVCGCDHMTYYTPCVAEREGVNVAAQGECTGTTVSCTHTGSPSGGTSSTCMPAHAHAACYRSRTSCSGTAPTSGVCWVMPDTCPTETDSNTYCNLGSPMCVGLCEGIVANDPLWRNNTSNCDSN